VGKGEDSPKEGKRKRKNRTYDLRPQRIKKEAAGASTIVKGYETWGGLGKGPEATPVLAGGRGGEEIIFIPTS